jgi:hypothetical protein
MNLRPRQWLWLTLLLLVWLLCSGSSWASPLSERVGQFPNWHSKPLVQPAQGDLSYPTWFAGTWAVQTTLVDLAAPLAPEIVTPGFEGNRAYLDQPIQFQARFVEGRSPQPSSFPIKLQSTDVNRPPIVADRAFNGLSLAKAYLGDRAVRAVKVDPENPNRQITLLRGASQRGFGGDRPVALYHYQLEFWPLTSQPSSASPISQLSTAIAGR